MAWRTLLAASLLALACAAPPASIELATGRLALRLPLDHLKDAPQALGVHVLALSEEALPSGHAALTAALAGCGDVLAYLPPTAFLIHAASPRCLAGAAGLAVAMAPLPPALRLGRTLTEALASGAAVSVLSVQLAPSAGLAGLRAAVAAACPACAVRPREASTAWVQLAGQEGPLPAGLALALATALPEAVYIDQSVAPQARNLHGVASQLTTDFHNFGGVEREFGVCTPACNQAPSVPFVQVAGVAWAAGPLPPPPAPVCSSACTSLACGNGFASGCGDGRTPVEAAGLSGAGQLVQVVDSGLDTGNPYFFDAAVPAPRRRTNALPLTPSPHRKIADVWAYVDGVDANGHGTHCAGSVAGAAGPAIQQAGANATAADRVVLPLSDGTAPGARLAIADIQCDTPASQGGCTTIDGAACTGFCFPSYAAIFDAAYGLGARISSNSWGPPDGRGYYTQVSVDIDTYAHAHPDALFVWAADNQGMARGSQSIGEDAAAKNVLAVGATQDGALAHAAKVRGGEHAGRPFPALLQPFSPFSCGAVLAEAALAGLDVTQNASDAHCAALAASGVTVTVPGGFGPGSPYGAAGNLEFPLCLGCTPRQLLPSATTAARVLWEWAGYSRFATPFSSIGPTSDGRIKPDVTAPGADIISAGTSFRTPNSPSAPNAWATDHAYGQWLPACGSTGATPTDYSNAGALPTLQPVTGATTVVPFAIVDPMLLLSVAFNYTGATVGQSVFLTIPGAGLARRGFVFSTAAGTASFNVSHHLGPGMGQFGTVSLVFTWGAGAAINIFLPDAVATAPPPCWGALGATMALTLTYARGGAQAFTAPMSGTSMSTPLVAGTVALVRQYFTDGYYSIPASMPVLRSPATAFAPSAALMKAVTINSASQLLYNDYCKLSGATQFDCASAYPLSQIFAQGGHGVPSLARGLGFAAGLGPSATIAAGTAPSLLLPGLTAAAAPPLLPPASLDPLLTRPALRGVDPSISAGGVAVYCVDTMGAPSAGGAPPLPLSVTLVWTDPPGSPLSLFVLVNNLDLEVTPPGGGPREVRYGNNNASHFPQVPDSLNNVEKVYWPAPAPTLGAGGVRLSAPYTVLVRGTRVPMGPQAFSLVVTGPGVTLAAAGTGGCGADPGTFSSSPSPSPPPPSAAPQPPAAAPAPAPAQVAALTATAGVLGGLLLLAVGLGLGFALGAFRSCLPGSSQAPKYTSSSSDVSSPNPLAQGSVPLALNGDGEEAVKPALPGAVAEWGSSSAPATQPAV